MFLKTKSDQNVNKIGDDVIKLVERDVILDKEVKEYLGQNVKGNLRPETYPEIYFRQN